MTIQETVYQQMEDEAGEAYRQYITLRHVEPALANEWLDYSITVDQQAVQVYWMGKAEFRQWKYWNFNQAVATIFPAIDPQQLTLF